MLDAQRFCNDYNIEYARSGKHFRNGWANLPCPFCTGHAGFHLGINIDEAYSVCHRCGFHPLPKVIAALTGTNYNIAKDIIKKYSTVSTTVRPNNDPKNIPSQIKFPSDTGSLTNRAKKYLIQRNFDPDKLATTWGLLSTGHIGFYKNRILAPIYQNHILVSYQCRDITNKHPQKYLACNQDEEIVQHQHTIYGLDQAQKRQCIVVEGITDVWRLGPGTVATFGISFTKLQAQLIAKHFDKVFILFDGEPQAQEKAGELGFLIGSAFNNPVEVINLPFLISDIDPGDLPQNIADKLMGEIGL